MLRRLSPRAALSQLGLTGDQEAGSSVAIEHDGTHAVSGNVPAGSSVSLPVTNHLGTHAGNGGINTALGSGEQVGRRVSEILTATFDASGRRAVNHGAPSLQNRTVTIATKPRASSTSAHSTSY